MLWDLWDLGNKKGRTYAQPIIVRTGEALALTIIVRMGEALANYYTTKIETILKTTK